jgi:hypothetical protein
MDQSSARSSVSVHKGMDGLELRVCNGGLHDGRQRIVVTELDEILHQVFHTLGRRRHERGVARVVVASADPVLDLSGASAVVCEPRTNKLFVRPKPRGGGRHARSRLDLGTPCSV